METIIEQFTQIPLEKFIFTKLDETNSIGTMFNLMIKYNKGLAYYTNGQEVPEDIEQPSLDSLFELFFQGDNQMRDQAEKLRMKMLESQGALGRSIAVVSGKGGVGKSNFSTNFATLLAQAGKKVVIVDMDIGMGNIHILIGKSVQYSLKDYLVGEFDNRRCDV